MKNIFAICFDWLISRFWHIFVFLGGIYTIVLIDLTDWFQQKFQIQNSIIFGYCRDVKWKLLDKEITFRSLFFDSETIYYTILIFGITLVVFYFFFIYEPIKDWFIGLKNEVTGKVKPVIYKLVGFTWLLNRGWEILTGWIKGWIKSIIKWIAMLNCLDNIFTTKTKSISDQIPNHALDLEWVNSNVDGQLEQEFVNLYVKEYLEFARDLNQSIIDNATRLKRESLVIFYDGTQGSGKSSITNLMQNLKLMNGSNIAIDHKYDYFSKNQVALRKHLNPDDKHPNKHNLFVPSPYIYKFDTTQVQNTNNFTKALLDEIEFILHENNILSENIINKYYDTVTSKVDGLSWLKLLPIQKKPESVSEQKEKISKKLNLFDKPIIIIIDEVDRLNPKQVYNLFNSINFVCGFQNLVFVVNLDFGLIKQTTSFEYLPVFKQSSAVVSGVYGGVPGHITPHSKILESIFEEGSKSKIQINSIYQKYHQKLIDKKMSGYSIFTLMGGGKINVDNEELLQLIRETRTLVGDKIDTSINWIDILPITYENKNEKLIPFIIKETVKIEETKIETQKIKITQEILYLIYELYFNAWADSDRAAKLELFTILYFYKNNRHWMEDILVDYCKNYNKINLIEAKITLENLDLDNKTKMNFELQKFAINQYLATVNYRDIISRIKNLSPEKIERLKLQNQIITVQNLTDESKS